MIKPKTICVVLFFVAFSCKNSSTNQTVTTDSPVISQVSQDVSEPTPNDAPVTNHWEQLPIREVAYLILSDSIRPITTPVIYKMLDSLTSELKESRQFYFKVFNKIMNKADGELAESIGGYALTYVQNYPKEFLENSTSLSPNQLEAWASNIGIELFLASHQNMKEAFDQVVVLINDNCKGCSGSQRNRLKNFTNRIWSTIRENQQAER